jgi:hypothetical protein
MSLTAHQDVPVGTQSDVWKRSAIIIEIFDQWNNPPEAHAAMCWCAPPPIERPTAR